MKIQITIDIDSTPFLPSPGRELSRILLLMAADAEESGQCPARNIHDSYGHKVGDVKLLGDWE